MDSKGRYHDQAARLTASEIEAAKLGEPVREARTFATGATRDTNVDKPDYEGFLSPTVMIRFGEYMHKHRHQSDGKLRASDNWQKGIPLVEYMSSLYRHFVDLWAIHRGVMSREGLEDTLCALFFNVQGYLHETLKAPRFAPVDDVIPTVRILEPDPYPDLSAWSETEMANYVMQQNEGDAMLRAIRQVGAERYRRGHS